MPEVTELKPNKRAFVFYSWIKSVLLLLVLIGVFFLLAFMVLSVPQAWDLPPTVKGYASWVLVLAPFLFLFLSALSYYSLSVRYRKEKYFFKNGKILKQGGGIFSDHETELNVKKITHVTKIRPFIENKLFGTGKIRVESAGGGGTEILIQSIDSPSRVYEFMERIMQEQGFTLSKQELIQHEKPNLLGVFFEVVRGFGSTSILLFFVLLAFLPTLLWVIASGTFNIFTTGFLGLILVAAISIHVIKFLDLKNRDYWVYSDLIVYDEGFLTKVDSFIPIENLADASLTQTLVDKIFSLYDVKVSCQGSGQEILFKNISKGKEMEQNIDSLLEETESLYLKERETEKKRKTMEKVKEYREEKALPETPYTGLFRIHFPRLVAPVLFGWGFLFLLFLIALIVVPFSSFGVIVAIGAIAVFLGVVSGLIGVVTAYIKAKCTEYRVGKKSIGEKYSFLHRRDIEFVNEKITGVIFKEDFIDSWFNTFSIKFWSIGSSADLTFSHIKKSPELIENLKKKFNFSEKNQLYKSSSSFNAMKYLKANFYLNILCTIVFFALIFAGIVFSWVFLVLAVLLGLIYFIVLFYKFAFYKTSKIHFFKNHVLFEHGIFFKKRFLALYRKIKDIETVKYPFSSTGTISFNVAGEGVQQSGQTQQQSSGIQSHGFAIHYIDGIETMDELIDLIFYQRPNREEIRAMEANLETYSPETIMEKKPNPANNVFVTIIILAFLNVLGWVFLGKAILSLSPYLIPLLLVVDFALVLTAFIWVKMKTYYIQPYRVFAQWGILYKHQKSVVFNKVDHINQFQGAVNKLFGNGRVTVNTTGSSSPELILKDMPDYKQFYETLKQFY